MDPARPGQKRRRDAPSPLEEPDYERAPRQNHPEWMHHGRSRLPIKTADGAVAANPVKRIAGTRQAPAQSEESDASEGEEGAGEEEDDDGGESHSGAVKPHRKNGPAPPPAVSFADLSRLPAAAVLERRGGLKAAIATLASAIISSPERGIAERSKADDERPKPSQADGAPYRPRVSVPTPLQQLQLLCGDADPVIRKLSMLSCVAVFRDVAPGYRVRLPTAAEVSARVRKDVRKLRAFEAALLTGYQRFLKYLEHTVVTGEAAGHRLHVRLSAAPGGGGGEQPPPATHGSSRFDADQSAADREGGGDDDEGAEAGGKASAGGKAAAHGIALKDWNAQKMAAKRERIAQRDSTAAYAADDETLHGLGLAALQCMAELAAALSHFNFHANVAGFLVARAVTGVDAEAIASACGALKAIFRGDAGGEATALAVRSIAAAVKAAVERPGGLRRVRPEALLTLLHINVGSLEVGRAGGGAGREFALQQAQERKKAKKKKAAGAKGSKDPFDDADVLAGLKASDAESLVERRRFAAAALKHAVAIFFRVLKAPGHSEALISPVLGGLARVAHLIDVSVVADLLRCLRALLVASARGGGGGPQDDDTSGAGAPPAARLRLDVAAALHCVLAALQIMDGPGELLNADEADFARFLYASLLRLTEPPAGGSGGEEEGRAADSSAHAALAAKTVAALLLRRREYSVERVAAFALRLLQVALSLPAHATLSLVAVSRALLARYPAAAAVLAPPSELVRGGRASALDAFLRAAAHDTSQQQQQQGKQKHGKHASSAAAKAAAAPSALSSGSAQAAAATGVSPAERAFLFDCDRSGSLSQTAWPLAALLSHFHPKVASTAAASLRQAPLLPADGADALFREYDPSSGAFNPAPPIPQPHPFAARVAAVKEAAGAAAASAATPTQRRLQRRRARQQLCFLSPPPLAPYLACLIAEEDGGVAGALPGRWEGGSGGLDAVEPALAAGLEAHCATSQRKLARRCEQGIARLRERLESRRSGPGVGDAAHG